MNKTALQQLIEEAAGKGTRKGIVPPKKSRPVFTFLVVFLVPVAILLLGLEMCSFSSSTPSSTEDIFSDTGKQFAWMELGKKSIAGVLKDPDSAKFREVYFSAPMIDGRKIPVTCGEVNAKNTFGGYSGFQRFVAINKEMALLESQVSDFEKLWAGMCLRS